MSKIELNTPLTIDEIDFRIQSVTTSGYATILAYKDARVDMNRLDAVYGVDQWKREHFLLGNKEFCRVSIWSDKLQQWVWKEDCGVESNTEKEKGETSDAFKRACFNLGIGRELYDYPRILIQLNQGEYEVQGQKAKAKIYLSQWKFESRFNDGKLTMLKCYDKSSTLRFHFEDGKTINVSKAQPPQQQVQPTQPEPIPQQPQQVALTISQDWLTAIGDIKDLKACNDFLTKNRETLKAQGNIGSYFNRTMQAKGYKYNKETNLFE